MATKSMTSNSSAPIVLEKTSGNSGVKAVVAIVVLVGGYFVVKNWNQKRKQQETEGQLQDNKSVQIATLLRNALDKWFGADIATIIQVAPQVTNFDSVARAYESLYHRSLTQDLTSKLSPEQLNQFYSQMRVKGRPETERTFIDRNVTNVPIKKGDMIFIDWQGKSFISLFKNSEDYPVKIYTRLLKPARISPSPFGKVLQVDKINYKTGNVTALLAWVQIATGQKYWIRLSDLKK